MRDPLLVVIKKADADEISVQLDIDEEAKEVKADDDCISETSQSMLAVCPNISGFDTRRSEVSSDTKMINIQRSTKRIESRTNKAGLKVPKENFIKLTPEKEKSIHKDPSIVSKPGNTEIIESDKYFIITLKASRRRKIAKRRISAIKAVPKPSKHSVEITKVKFESEVLRSESVAKIPKTILIQQQTAFKNSPSLKNPDAIHTTVSPIVLHGAAQASEKYDDKPNDAFYAELRDFNKPTRWNKDIQRRKRSISSIPHSKKSSKLYPIKFATFLVRITAPKTELPAKYEASILKTNKIRKDKTKSVDALQTSTIEVESQVPLMSECEETHIVSPKSIDVKKSRMLIIKGSEIPHDASHVHPIATKPLDPFTMNPIRFRKELRALCRSKSHDEPIMVPRKENKELAKFGAIPKIFAPLKVKKVKESTPQRESGAVPNTQGTLKRKRAQQIEILPETRNIKTGSKAASLKTCAMFEPGALPESNIPPELGALPESNIIPELGAFPESNILPEFCALPEASVLLKSCALPETFILPETVHLPGSSSLPKTGDFPIADALPGTIPLPETSGLPKTQTDPTLGSKNKHATITKSFQFRDIPVVAYVNRSKYNQRNTKSKKHLKNEDLLGYYWKKFKHYKRYESDRQQILLNKVMFTVPQVDAAMFAAQMLIFKIEILRQESCETEECLRNRNSRMKWLMSRLVGKTTKINSLLESIRCNVVMYTLEANASNSVASKRLDKILKLCCEDEECTRKSESVNGAIVDEVKETVEEISES